MFRLTIGETHLIGLSVEGFFYGLYSGIFTMYVQYRVSKKDTEKSQNIIFYALCVLYVLCSVNIVCDLASVVCIFTNSSASGYPIDLVQTTVYCCGDFISQFILIYRCWLVWGRNIVIVIIPSILSFAFLGTWIACSASVYISSDQLVTPYWGFASGLTTLVLSLTVNALVMGLIVFRIFKAVQGNKATSDDRVLGDAPRSKLWPVILVLVESGMALFSIQLIRLVVTIVPTDAAIRAFNITTGIHPILNGITPTIILVRISMGLSFHDEKSMEEQVATASFRFGSYHSNSISETGRVSIVDEDNRGDDIGVQKK